MTLLLGLSGSKYLLIVPIGTDSNVADLFTKVSVSVSMYDRAAANFCGLLETRDLKLACISGYTRAQRAKRFCHRQMFAAPKTHFPAAFAVDFIFSAFVRKIY